MLHGDVGAFDLPAVSLVTHSKHARLVALGSGIEEREDEAVRVRGVMMHELRQVGEAIVGRDVHLQHDRHNLIIILLQ